MRSGIRVAVACCLAAFPGCSRAERPPDIVILLADDLGWADVGYHGSDASGTIRTPHIDALAAGGLRLERYRTAALCTPARAGFLTGRSPLRFGLLKNIDQADAGSLPLAEELLPSAFARKGYATAMIGKWHLGHSRKEQWPNARGFERFYGFHGGWIDYQKHERNGVADWWRDTEPVSEAGYSTQLFADEAVKMLAEKGRERPLLLYVAFNAPHAPVQVPPGRTVVGGTPEDAMRKTYAVMVGELDDAVGKILGAIEKGPRARETIVFFASDNGADTRYGGSNAPLRDGKRSAFDGGIRSPAVISWPGHVTAGASEILVTHLDALATLAGLAGVTLEPARPLDGKNVWPELERGTPGAHEPVAFGCESGEERRYALVGERWKLVETVSAAGSAPTDALFDIDADPGETRDVSAAAGDQISVLRAKLQPWTSMATVPR
ncbi:MAG TPA: arylsulfatase [Planctomycetota bacterium]|jgi:arylsulfatase A-like enzyme|nr:arylsulfatase [Planctomycetota bacterium]